MSYRTFWDENGDETIELEDGPWSLPANYQEREVDLAVLNLYWREADRREMPVSRKTLHLAVQETRKIWPAFGSKFKKDPRRFSSTPLPKANVG